MDAAKQLDHNDTGQAVFHGHVAYNEFAKKMNCQIKRLVFLGDALEQVRDFPRAAHKEAGVQLHKVQQASIRATGKLMTSIGQGVREIRIRDEADRWQPSRKISRDLRSLPGFGNHSDVVVRTT